LGTGARWEQDGTARGLTASGGGTLARSLHPRTELRAYNPPNFAVGGATKNEMNEEERVEPEDDYAPDLEDEDEAAAEEEAEAEEGEESSLDAILAKKPEERAAPEEEDDEESILSLGREERLETLSVKVVPKQDTEFVCRKCYLVKPIRSQLADKKRMYCRDCV
jgi:Domain of unknown function (DUF4193)